VSGPSKSLQYSRSAKTSTIALKKIPAVVIVIRPDFRFLGLTDFRFLFGVIECH
jgi:hypothetical protein